MRRLVSGIGWHGQMCSSLRTVLQSAIALSLASLIVAQPAVGKPAGPAKVVAAERALNAAERATAHVEIDAARAYLAACVEAWGDADVRTQTCRLRLAEPLWIDAQLDEAEQVVDAALAYFSQSRNAPNEMVRRAKIIQAEIIARKGNSKLAYADYSRFVASIPTSDSENYIRGHALLSRIAYDAGDMAAAKTEIETAANHFASQNNVGLWTRILLHEAEANFESHANNGLEEVGRNITIRESYLIELENAFGREGQRLSFFLETYCSEAIYARGVSESRSCAERQIRIEEGRQKPNASRLASAVADLGSTYQFEQDAVMAARLSQSVLEISEAAGEKNLQRMWLRYFNHGRNLREIGRFGESEAALRKALELVRSVEGADHISVTFPLRELQQAIRMQNDGRDAEALALQEEARNIALKFFGPGHIQTALMNLYLASAYSDAGRAAEAVPILTENLPIAKGLFGVSSASYASFKSTLATAYLKSGQLENAAIETREAFDILHNRPIGLVFARSGIQSRIAEFSVLYDRIERDAFELSVAGKNLEETAFAAHQIGQGGLGLQYAWRAANRLRDSSDQVRALTDELNAVEAKLTKAEQSVGNGDLASASNAALEALQEVSALRTQRQGLLARLEAIDPEFFEFSRGSQVKLADLSDPLRSPLRSDEALIVISPDRFQTKLYFVRHGKVRLLLVALRAAEVRDLIDRIRSSTNIAAAATSDHLPAFDIETAHLLHSALFSRLRGDLKGIKRISISATGVWSQLPLSLLVEKPGSRNLSPFERLRRTRWLVDRYAITSLPGTAALWLRANRPKDIPAAGASARYKSLVFADPALPNLGEKATIMRGTGGAPIATVDTRRRTASLACRLAALPDTRREAEAFQMAMGRQNATVVLAQNVSEATLQDLDQSGSLSSYRNILFATHGVMSGAGAADEPAIVMTPGSTCDTNDESKDGLLSASEISLLNLDADWVILSACNTASGAVGNQKPAFTGLVSAFFYAGARNVMASHWAVNSEASADLVTATAAARARGARLDDALRAAMLHMKNSKGHRAHPAFWAPYVMASIE